MHPLKYMPGRTITFLHYCFWFVLLFTSCRQQENHGQETVSRVLSGISDTDETDSTNCIMDSAFFYRVLFQLDLSMEMRNKIADYYSQRYFKMNWMSSSGLNEFAGNFINLVNSEPKKDNSDSSIFNDPLHLNFNLAKERKEKFSFRDSSSLTLEILLTSEFFKYASRNWQGSAEAISKSSGWFIDRKRLNYPSLLAEYMQQNNGPVNFKPPVYRQYGLLKYFLAKYKAMEDDSLWHVEWPQPSFPVKDGDSLIKPMKQTLWLLGDLDKEDSTFTLDSLFQEALKRFQLRHGLKETGKPDMKTYMQIRVPIKERIKQLLINMERCRWVPPHQQGDYLAVNIPDFRLFVYQGDSLQWSCKVVVGDLENNTVIFNNQLEYIVLSPYWVIPSSIIYKETLPALRKDPKYLSKHAMEVVSRSGELINPSSINWNQLTEKKFPYSIRQKPGKNNSLGFVKFIFPNEHSIYLHDTPSKSLFGETNRAFSHGCIRVAEPFRLVEYLLRNDSTWTKSRIKKTMYGGTETIVKLKKKIPVFIAYFTAFVDRQGRLHFREDIYGHDEKLRGILFKE